MNLLRGPALIVPIAVSILIQHLNITFDTLAKLVLVAVGCYLTILDVRIWLVAHLKQNYVRPLFESIQMRSSTFVLDEFLQNLFQNNNWLLHCCQGCVGSFLVYAVLPTTPQQRITLLQSTLKLTDEQARTVLTSPGGIRAVLPVRLQEWFLSMSGEQQEHNEQEFEEQEQEEVCAKSADYLPTTLKEPMILDGISDPYLIDSEDYSSDESLPDDASQPQLHDEAASHCSLLSVTNVLNESHTAVPEPDNDSAGVPRNVQSAVMPPLNHDSPASLPRVLFDIVRDLLEERLCRKSSQQLLLKMGAMSAAALLAHVATSRRARNMALVVAEGTALVGMASVVAMAATMSRMYRTQQQQVETDATLTSTAALLWSAIHGKPRRWKGIVAVAVLAYFYRRNRSTGRRRA
jgi:hypothetical protein